jgi:hypothetical protein
MDVTSAVLRSLENKELRHYGRTERLVEETQNMLALIFVVEQERGLVCGWPCIM